MAVRLFIGNLSYDVTEAELRAHFAAIGPLSSLALPTDRETGKPRGFAFVEFRDRADGEEAIRRLNNQMFKGRPLAVSEARARDDHATPTTPGASRPSAPRPPTSAPRPPASASRPPAPAAMSTEDSRDFGPDMAPRRRRLPAKSTMKTERGPKRPIYKRSPGPVRFSTVDDDDGDEDERAPHNARRRTNAGEHDTA